MWFVVSSSSFVIFKTWLVLLCIENVHKLPNHRLFMHFYWIVSEQCQCDEVCLRHHFSASCGWVLIEQNLEVCWHPPNQAKVIKNQNFTTHIITNGHYWHPANSVHLHWPKLSFQYCKTSPKTFCQFILGFFCAEVFFQIPSGHPVLQYTFAASISDAATVISGSLFPGSPVRFLSIAQKLQRKG